MLTNNKKIRDLIDTITCNAFLILSRFTSERKTVLDAWRFGPAVNLLYQPRMCMIMTNTLLLYRAAIR